MQPSRGVADGRSVTPFECPTYTPPPVLILPNPPAVVIVTSPILGLTTYATLQDYVNNRAQVTAGEEEADLGDTEAISVIDSLIGGL